MKTLQILEKIRKKRGAVAIALIDPDGKYDNNLLKMIDLINSTDFDAIFIGGSLITDNEFEVRVKLVKKHTSLPVIIFPGSSSQLSSYADAVLFLSLISGRNSQYLIGEQVKSAPVINRLKLEAIPTAYILLEGGRRSSVEIISNTSPIPMDKQDIILAHSLAGQYLGNKFIFLESGSGANNHANYDLVRILSDHLSIPIIIGGGVNSSTAASKLVNSGAGYIVTGTQIENIPSKEQLIKYTQAIHLNG